MKNGILDILRKTNAIITDSHIVYTSGKHGSVYINKDAIYPHIEYASMVGKIFAEKFKNKAIDVVAAPALGGIILSQWTAYHLSKLRKKKILGIYTEKDENKNQVFTRGYDKFVKDKKVLVIEDLTTTGGSVKKVVISVKKAGGKVVGVGVMINRNPKEVNSKFLKSPFVALGVLKAEAFDEDKCPLCKNGVPVNTSVGHGKKYLQSHKTH